MCLGGVVEVGSHEPGVLGDGVYVQCLVVSAAALERGVDGLAATEEADSAVPRGDQVRDRGVGAAGVVGEHGVGVKEARRAIEEHERDAAGAFAQVAMVGAGGDDDEGVDAPGGERCRELAFSLGVFVGAASQGDDVAGPGDVLDSAMNGGEEGVADVLQDEADAARRAVGAPQCAGDIVALVAEQPDRFQHTRQAVVADGRIAVERARHGGDADAGERRDLLHRGSASRVSGGGRARHG